MKTVLTVKITLADDEWDRLERRFSNSAPVITALIETVIADALTDDMGIIVGAEVTKIE